eukprot:g20824.t1
MGESGLRGLNLGMYNLSVKSVNPFPVVRLLGVNEDGGRDPSDLHSFLRPLDDLQRQSQALRELTSADRLALTQWLANGGTGAS